MRVRAVLVVLVVALVASCSSGGAGGHVPGAVRAGLHPGQLTSGGLTRSYLLYKPPGLNASRRAPLVLVLGGVGNTAQDMINVAQLDPLASADGFLVAYPEGLDGSSWNAGFCCAGAFVHHVDDVGFLVALIRHLEAGEGVDPHRVYITGVSDGAMMAYRVACQQAGLVSGVGSVAGAMVLASCHPAHAVSVIEIHGTADSLVPYQGGLIQPPGAMASAPAPSSQALSARWASLDGCRASPRIHHNGPVTTSSWSGCRHGTAVSLVSVVGGGHTWFSQGFGPIDGAVDASSTIINFFHLDAVVPPG
ncbi:MAG: CE1 family esterase [Acidimicrobiales bacterium]